MTIQVAVSSEQNSALPQEMLQRALIRAAKLARFGAANTLNPQVGCIIINRAGRIVAEGWHNGAGTAHAEIMALAALPKTLQALEQKPELTAVVTLEPCAHTGRTGPCVAALLAAGITDVVYAVTDNSPLACGGAAQLVKHGVRVTQLYSAECELLAAEWQQRQTELQDQQGTQATVVPQDSQLAARDKHTQQPGQTAPVRRAKLAASTAEIPFVTLKWAQSLDGRIAAQDGSSQWITGTEARQDVHQRRAQADAIIVGTGTVLTDNPTLTARTVAGELLVSAANQPVPVVFGDRQIPKTAAINSHPALAVRNLKKPLQFGRQDLLKSLKALKVAGCNRVFVEGGAGLITEFLRAGIYDEILIYIAPVLLGGQQLAVQNIGVESISEALRFNEIARARLGQDTLVRVLRSSDPQPKIAGANAAE